NIKKAYPSSSHNVIGAKELHFKQAPNQALMEFAIHNLFYRIAGDLTPATTLVRFEVQMESKTKVYPVLISQTIEGRTLEAAVSSHEAGFEITDEAELPSAQWARWTWMLLCSLLIKPGDGRFSSYILDARDNIFCIDNGNAFIELQVGIIFKNV